MILWHNPRCTKSRQTLALLEGRGYRPRIRPYLHDAPSEEEIRAVLAKLGIKPIGMIRRREKIFAELELTPESPDDVLISAMAQNPILIERPILITEDAAAIGRPPEAILPLLA